MSKLFYLTSVVAIPAAFMVASRVVNVDALARNAAPVRAWSMVASLHAFDVFNLLLVSRVPAYRGRRTKV